MESVDAVHLLDEGGDDFVAVVTGERARGLYLAQANEHRGSVDVVC